MSAVFFASPEDVADRAERRLSCRPDRTPNLPIEARGPFGDAFLLNGAMDFPAACALVRNLPWGPLEDPANPLAVLEEGRGDAVSKHALLVSLLRECGEPGAELVLAFYRLDAEAAPEAAALLRRAGVASLPDLHAFLRVLGGEYDFTTNGREETVLTVLADAPVSVEGAAAEADRRYDDFLLRSVVQTRGAAADWRELRRLRDACTEQRQKADARRREEEAALQAAIASAQAERREALSRLADLSARPKPPPRPQAPPPPPEPEPTPDAIEAPAKKPRAKK